MSESGSGKLRAIIRVLDDRYGEIHWWPGTPEEVMIGAVLTQQTRWENVICALDNLKRKGICSIRGIHKADPAEIEDAIRCSGFFRVKTKRLKALADFIFAHYGSVESMRQVSTPELRRKLLEVHGIGEETADSILCYALHRPSFIIDAYTERICSCLGINEKKGRLKSLFEANLPAEDTIHRKCHAHFVEFAKEFCGNKRCDVCILKNVDG